MDRHHLTGKYPGTCLRHTTTCGVLWVEQVGLSHSVVCTAPTPSHQFGCTQGKLPVAVHHSASPALVTPRARYREGRALSPHRNRNTVNGTRSKRTAELHAADSTRSPVNYYFVSTSYPTMINQFSLFGCLCCNCQVSNGNS